MFRKGKTKLKLVDIRCIEKISFADNLEHLTELPVFCIKQNLFVCDLSLAFDFVWTDKT